MMYTSHCDAWEERATIRSRPRRVIEDDNLLRYFPIERQPLCLHPQIAGLDQTRLDFIALQGLYKYLNDIIIFETEIVNKTAREISRGVFPFPFPFDCRYDALSVVIDEEYHAYVAMDYLNQVEKATGIGPIQLPRQIELSLAIPAAAEQLSSKHRAGLELIAVAIAENTVTADVAAFARDNTVRRSVKGLMADHLADEGRHSIFWGKIVKLYWQAIDEEARMAIGQVLPSFLRTYLTNEIQHEFEQRLVAALNLSPEVTAEIDGDLVRAYPITSNHPIIGNIRHFLTRSTLLDHEPTRSSLAEFVTPTVAAKC